jgi:hypothetical protein
VKASGCAAARSTAAAAAAKIYLQWVRHSGTAQHFIDADSKELMVAVQILHPHSRATAHHVWQLVMLHPHCWALRKTATECLASCASEHTPSGDITFSPFTTAAAAAHGSPVKLGVISDKPAAAACSTNSC